LERKGRKLPAISGVSAQTNRAIREGMAVYYSDRLQTIEEFLALLPVPQGVKALPPPTPPDPGFRINLYTLYATILGILVAVILAGQAHLIWYKLYLTKRQ
jgi:eukaryotic-like serine/threonine-protein kinase